MFPFAYKTFLLNKFMNWGAGGLGVGWGGGIHCQMCQLPIRENRVMTET